MLLRFLFAAVLFLAAVGSANACTCGLDWPPSHLKGDNEAIGKWLLDKAENVVRGRIISLRAGNDVTIGDRRVVMATMKVDATVKGDVGPGEITLVTGFGLGDCGIPVHLLLAIAWGRDATFEITKSKDLPDKYGISHCGYWHVGPPENLKQKKKN